MSKSSPACFEISRLIASASNLIASCGNAAWKDSKSATTLRRSAGFGTTDIERYRRRMLAAMTLPGDTLPRGTAPYYRSVDSTVLVALMGILGTLGAALGTRWIDNRQQTRVWLRDQRLEAHHAFLNRVNRLLAASEAITSSSPDTANSDGLR